MSRPKLHESGAARTRAWRERHRNGSVTIPEAEDEETPGVTAAPFRITGSKGQPLASIIEGRAGGGLLVVYDHLGQPSVVLTGGPSGGKLGLFSAGEVAATLCANETEGGALSLRDPEKAIIATLKRGPAGAGRLTLQHPNGWGDIYGPDV